MKRFIFCLSMVLLPNCFAGEEHTKVIASNYEFDRVVQHGNGPCVSFLRRDGTLVSQFVTGAALQGASVNFEGDECALVYKQHNGKIVFVRLRDNDQFRSYTPLDYVVRNKKLAHFGYNDDGIFITRWE